MNVFRIYSLFSHFRAARFDWFLSINKPELKEKILDVGGFPYTWTTYQPYVGSIDCLNIHEIPYDSLQYPEHHIRTVVGNGCALTYSDQSYDTVYSNSVIEHLHTWENQVAFANEMRRVGKKLWIQTPAEEFFVEPHYITPFIHWVPKKLRVKMLRYFTVWGHLSKPTPQKAQEMVDEIRLLKYEEMIELFPDCQILKEKFLGVFTKSYVAVRN
jgi:predicted SAM-dependent methyltransferase